MTPDQFSDALTAVVNAVLLLWFVCGVFGVWVGYLGLPLLRWLLWRSESYRAWRRRVERVERMELAAWLRERGSLSHE